ncbi:MAG TPA: DUF2235 domain-containing protein [Pseudolabrys sp.]
MAKNIVLFSDGTGNSSASPFKTNVWRLYQTIDIEPPTDPKDPQQIIYYDNGVGTENFKPIAALGGALGIGVWQNVRDIYTFVCRNYAVGDQIYGFGFSRGAFTIRLLMGLIGKCGLLKAGSEAELVQGVQMAYEAYRRDFLIRASKRRHMVYHHILRPPKYFKDEEGRPTTTIDLGEAGCEQAFPDVRFVGVWDTVDAYGMPVDELKLAIDEWVWPMSFADRDPSDRLLTIRHALSLDDERPTFRPVLWNEVLKDLHNPNDVTKQKILSPERIQQVWFAGVHANVGGGYPDDGLAFTALKWMMDEAGKGPFGLRYDPLFSDEIAGHVNPDGEEYDSRSGIAGYYRYGPRQVAALSHDADHGVDVPTVHVHPAAFERIAAWRRDYEPVSLGGPFSVAGVAQAPADAAAMENAWDMVWWRRFAYFTTLALTAFVGLFALRLAFEWPNVILKCTEAELQWLWSYVTWTLGPAWSGRIAAWWYWVLDHVGAVLPSWADPAIPSFKQYPLSGIVSLALLAWAFLFWSRKLEQRIEVLAEWAWASHKGLAAAAQPKTDWHNVVARPLRPVTALFYRGIWRGGLVPLLGIVIGVVALVLLSPYWLWRVFRRRPWMD